MPGLKLFPEDELTWQQSPCSSCPETFCCKNLPLCKIDFNKKKDFEKALFILGFKGMWAGLRENGDWFLFLHKTCTFLESDSAKCCLYGTKLRPKICLDFPAEGCWYKKAFRIDQSDLFIKFNRQRLVRFAEMIRYDHDDKIYRVPDWDVLISELGPIPFYTERFTSPEGDPTGTSDFLIFPPLELERRMGRDLLRFRLGFSGIACFFYSGGWLFTLPAVPLEDGQNNLLQKVREGYADDIIKDLDPQARSFINKGSSTVITLAQLAEINTR
jgi:hypothetical protein